MPLMRLHEMDAIYAYNVLPGSNLMFCVGCYGSTCRCDKNWTFHAMIKQANSALLGIRDIVFHILNGNNINARVFLLDQSLLAMQFGVDPS